ncbi:MAG: carboxylesterase family protein [Bacteroidales bacterium]|nr:carboxylesterase family protein [Bacteroidales bacterium]
MKKIAYFMCALLLAACTSAPKVDNGPVLTVEGGQIQGVAADIPGITVYRGIPYAAAPIGDLRWKEPQPVEPWDGVLLCNEFGHPGYQAVHYPGGYFTEWGYGEEKQCSEDCLYLNVWTPAAGKKDAKLPVAYWIHGGGYREGWGSEPEFDGQEFANKGVVLVSINYRLGVFGFLAHPELAAESPHGVSGNYGVLDMIQGLKWVKENIEQFGGDPNNVMIFGQSAGGGAVRTLCESPLAKPYFHKAVIMSAGGMGGMGGGRGAAARPAAPAGRPAAAPRGGMSFGPQTLEQIQENNKKILDWAGLTDLKKMRAAGTETIYALSTIYAGANRAGNGDSLFGGGPALTGAPIVDGYVSLESFDAAAMDGTLADVPYMMGFTKDDMGNMTDGIANFALNREEKGGKCYAYQFARPLPDDGSQKVYVLNGAFHSSDLWFVFKSLKHCWRPWTQGDWDLAEKQITYWANFAKYGDPNGPDGGEWTPYTKENPQFMVFKLDEADKEASEMGQPIAGERFSWPPVAPAAEK